MGRRPRPAGRGARTRALNRAPAIRPDFALVRVGARVRRAQDALRPRRRAVGADLSAGGGGCEEWSVGTVRLWRIVSDVVTVRASYAVRQPTAAATAAARSGGGAVASGLSRELAMLQRPASRQSSCLPSARAFAMHSSPGTRTGPEALNACSCASCATTARASW